MTTRPAFKSAIGNGKSRVRLANHPL